MGEKDLKKNLNFVNENRESLLKEHKDKFILVFEEKLVGSYDSYAIFVFISLRLCVRQ